jgi:hypothetical protein
MKMTDEYRIEKRGDCFHIIKITNLGIFFDRELAERFVGSLNQDGTVDQVVVEEIQKGITAGAEKRPARNISGSEWSDAEDAILMRYADQIPRPFDQLMPLLPGRTKSMINGRYARLVEKAKRRSSVLHPEGQADTKSTPPNTESISEGATAEVPDDLVAADVVQSSYQSPRRMLAVTGPDSGVPDRPIIVSADRLRAGR